MDCLQLCTQAIALEEMFDCNIDKGYLFYHEIARREEDVYKRQLHIWETLEEKLNAHLLTLQQGNKQTEINQLRNQISLECYQAGEKKQGIYTLAAPTEMCIRDRYAYRS